NAYDHFPCGKRLIHYFRLQIRYFFIRFPCNSDPAQLIGGGVAGIAGATEMLSNYTRFQWTATTGHGFDGLLVAVLAKKNPALVPIGALFLAYVRIGADVVNSTGDIPKEFITVIQGIIILLVAAESFMSGTKNKMIFKAAEKEKAEKEKQEANTAA
ncbi:MAG: hypothetical protein HFF03_07125, partial [Oscillospiraceae bacterium]|nr:hypothetical protein [Oscillospiraceae bacterium]